MVRVGHYLNQFFAGIGGEERANVPPSESLGAVGPGRLLQSLLGDGSVASTLVCGDNFFNEHLEDARDAVRAWLHRVRPGLVVAGPAFAAGRYGSACAEVCRLAAEGGVPAVTGMHPENPGVVMYRKAYIVPTGDSAADMARALPIVARLGRKLASGEAIGTAEDEGYLPRGIRRPGMRARPGAERAVAMLVAKLTGQRYRTELPVDAYESVPPAPRVRDLRQATIGIVTTGAIVPKGNPDHLKRCSETRWRPYDLGTRAALSSEEFECVHGGFYNQPACANPNVVLPLDVLRELERTGAFARLLDFYCTTTGNDQRLVDCKRNGAEIAQALRTAGAEGALLVAT
jgi:glycine reductase complex component B subunit gamma